MIISSHAATGILETGVFLSKGFRMSWDEPKYDSATCCLIRCVFVVLNPELGLHVCLLGGLPPFGVGRQSPGTGRVRAPLPSSPSALAVVRLDPALLCCPGVVHLRAPPYRHHHPAKWEGVDRRVHLCQFGLSTAPRPSLASRNTPHYPQEYPPTARLLLLIQVLHHR